MKDMHLQDNSILHLLNCNMTLLNLIVHLVNLTMKIHHKKKTQQDSGKCWINTSQHSGGTSQNIVFGKKIGFITLFSGGILTTSGVLTL